MTILDAIVEALLAASQYNPDDQTRPAAILWPDSARFWEPLLPKLRPRLPLLTLGDYDPKLRTGPSYWLRCAIADTVEVDWPEAFANDAERIPIIYLPGVGRSDLRTTEEIPSLLRPLAELQYRGVYWTQKNSRDWTPYAFLVSADGGLGIEVTSDAATRDALRASLGKLADTAVAQLQREAPLNASFFHQIMNPDPAREILNWLDDPAGFQSSRDAAGWKAFCQLLERTYNVDPETDGPITAAEHLGKRDGHWATVWQRYAEAPQRWPNIEEQLRNARPSPIQTSFLEAELEETWPQDNETAEDALRQQLTAIANNTASDARKKIRQLEQEHGCRRDWVWAELDKAPLAQALKWLTTICDGTERPLGGSTVTEKAEGWTTSGWQIDDAAMRAMASTDRAEDSAAVDAALRALYLPWLDEAATTFQAAYQRDPDDWRPATPITAEAGTCLLFTDALRFDIGQRLAEELDRRGQKPSSTWQFSALPSVTPTAKPAVSPVAAQLTGGSAFDTVPVSGGARLTANKLRDLLANEGYQIMRGSETGNPEAADARGWTELGAIDRYGHDHGRELTRHIEPEIKTIADRVEALLSAGWQQVTIITDHGWLLMPGGLPKSELPQHFTEPRKGRCARIKPGEAVSQQTVPWHWDADVQIAVPAGASCYEAGKEYEHGGLSLQECVVPVISVSAAAAPRPRVTISDVRWNRMWCRVEIEGAETGIHVDLRTRPADPSSSIVNGGRPVEENRVGLAIEDDSLIGEPVTLVVVDAEGTLLAQVETRVGG